MQFNVIYRSHSLSSLCARPFVRAAPLHNPGGCPSPGIVEGGGCALALGREVRRPGPGGALLKEKTTLSRGRGRSQERHWLLHGAVPPLPTLPQPPKGQGLGVLPGSDHTMGKEEAPYGQAASLIPRGKEYYVGE